jgi:hypothetical protein
MHRWDGKAFLKYLPGDHGTNFAANVWCVGSRGTESNQLTFEKYRFGYCDIIEMSCSNPWVVTDKKLSLLHILGADDVEKMPYCDG